jgi:hypothetical protein
MIARGGVGVDCVAVGIIDAAVVAAAPVPWRLILERVKLHN